MLFFSSRSEKKKTIFFDVDIVAKKKLKLKIEIWFIVVCTLIDNEYVHYSFRASLQEYLKRKCDAYK